MSVVEWFNVQQHTVGKHLAGISSRSAHNHGVADGGLPGELFGTEPTAEAAGVFPGQVSDHLVLYLDADGLVVILVVIFRNQPGYALSVCATLVVFSGEFLQGILVV